MQHKILLPCILVALVFLAVVRGVSAQSGFELAQITNVDAPASVPSGQPLTVTVTVSYRVNLLAAESLVIALVDHTENGKPFPTTANSGCSTNKQSICLAQTPGYGGAVGNYTASFTIIAPQPETYVVAVAAVVRLNTSGGFVVETSSYRVLQITITAPVPETNSPFLLLSLVFLVTVYLVKKKRPT